MVSVVYRSPSQNDNEFDTLLSNVQKVLHDNSKPSLSVVAGDLNSRCSSWWSNDINTAEGLNLFSLTSSNGFSQLIHDQHTSKQTVLLVLTNFLLTTQVYQLTLVSMHLFTQTAIKLYSLALTSLFTIPHHTND